MPGLGDGADLSGELEPNRGSDGTQSVKPAQEARQDLSGHVSLSLDAGAWLNGRNVPEQQCGLTMDSSLRLSHTILG